MPQTLLALLAVVGVTVLVQQGGRDRIDDAASTRRSEIEVQARGVATSVLERLSGVPFDGGEGGGTSAYSPSLSFGTGASAAGRLLDEVFADGTYDDLDDFHGVQSVVARHFVYDPASKETRPLDLSVDIEVSYVEQDDGGWVPPESYVRTPFKRAIVTVRASDLLAPVQLGRIYAAP